MRITSSKILGILLALAMMMAARCYPVYASDDIGVGLRGPTRLFVETCNQFFSDPMNYRALDKDQTDVSLVFYQRYLEKYRNQDFAALWKAFLNELYCITWSQIQTMNRSGNSFEPMTIDRYVSDTFYVLDSTTEHMPGKTFELLYTVSGGYTFEGRRIVAYTDAVLNIDSFNAGALFTYTLRNISTNARLGPNNLSVTFSASFNLDLHFNSLRIPGFEWWTESFGPYSGSVTGYAY
ncbi:MAG: hypothetical protein WAQ54_00235 [Bacillota bacterium]|jgi:hypothetical protein